MRYTTIILLLAACCACTKPSDFDRLIAENNQFDIAIMGGTVIDGSGNTRYLADLLINDDKVVFVGEVALEKIEVGQLIEAKGKIVSPGFIDVHVHGNPLSGTSFENFLASGVTTIMLGQDGYHPSLKGQPYAVAAYMDSLELTQLQLNVALMAGHGSLRRMSGIPDLEQPNEDQLNKLVELLKQALDAGCYGLSTGLEYVPGMYAKTKELNALARLVGEYDAVLASHMRNEDDEAIEASLEELLALGELCKIHASHLKVVYGKGIERGNTIIQLLETARKKGVAVSADVYPYTASYTGIGIVFPRWAKTQSQFETALKTRKEELENYLEQRIIKRNGPEATLFGSGPYAGKTLRQAAKEENISYVELLMKVGPQGASGAYFIMDQPLQDVFINHPEVMIASDGSPTMLHPRGHGSQARILQQYVNEQKTLNLESAIYKMSGLPAKTMGLANRGLIKPGHIADILIFDPAQVVEKATYANPYQFSEGFDQVIVNGVPVREEGALVNASAGKLLRKSGPN